MENEFHLPTYVDNIDANVAGLAEALVGAGKGKLIVYLHHSFDRCRGGGGGGGGGALVVDGKVVSGKNGHAGEVGNIIIDRSRKKYNHLNAGAAENEVSGTALIRNGRERLDPNITTAREVFDLAREGNAVALDIVDKMAYDFASMLSGDRTRG